jgi:hypothetical protein
MLFRGKDTGANKKENQGFDRRKLYSISRFETHISHDKIFLPCSPLNEPLFKRFSRKERNLSNFILKNISRSIRAQMPPLSRTGC